MIDAVVRLAGVAGWLARVIVGPTYGDSSSQGAAVGKQVLLSVEVRQRLLTGFFSCFTCAPIAAYYLSREAQNHLAVKRNGMLSEAFIVLRGQGLGGTVGWFSI